MPKFTVCILQWSKHLFFICILPPPHTHSTGLNLALPCISLNKPTRLRSLQAQNHYFIDLFEPFPFHDTPPLPRWCSWRTQVNFAFGYPREGAFPAGKPETPCLRSDVALVIQADCLHPVYLTAPGKLVVVAHLHQGSPRFIITSLHPTKMSYSCFLSCTPQSSNG